MKYFPTLGQFNKRQRFFLRITLLAICLYGIDRVSKYIALSYLHKPIVLIPNLLQLNVVGNKNFLFYVEAPTSIVFLTTALVSISLLWMAIKEHRQGNDHHVAFLIFVFIGAFSNILDRVRYGFVVDFISIPFWSVFNLADIYIILGVLALALSLWKEEHAPQANKTISKTS